MINKEGKFASSYLKVVHKFGWLKRLAIAKTLIGRVSCVLVGHASVYRVSIGLFLLKIDEVWYLFIRVISLVIASLYEQSMKS